MGPCPGQTQHGKGSALHGASHASKLAAAARHSTKSSLTNMPGGHMHQHWTACCACSINHTQSTCMLTWVVAVQVQGLQADAHPPVDHQAAHRPLPRGKSAAAAKKFASGWRKWLIELVVAWRCLYVLSMARKGVRWAAGQQLAMRQAGTLLRLNCHVLGWVARWGVLTVL